MSVRIASQDPLFIPSEEMRGIDLIKERIPSSRNSATVHRTVAFDFQIPGTMKKAPPKRWCFFHGGDEPRSTLLAHMDHTNDFAVRSNLEEGIGYTNIRNLPSCCILTNEPLRQIWLIGKEILQGPRKGRQRRT